MPKKVYIDFESRSQADIWVTGAYRYAEDPTTEILCLCWVVDNGIVKFLNVHALSMNIESHISILNDLIREGAEFHAHNAFFERCMWKFCLTPKYGALPIPIKQWRCTAAKAGAHALPRSLEKAALALGCINAKDKEGHKLMIQLSKSTGPIEEAKLNRLIRYCIKDVEVEREIDRKLVDLTPSEQRVWRMDQYLNDHGITIDIDTINLARKAIDKEKDELNAELHELTGGLINKGTQAVAIRKYLQSKGLDLPDLQKQTIKDALKTADPGNLRILQLRQQLSLTSLAKYEAFAAEVSEDKRIRDLLVFHGASTGRWAGKLVQLHNLVKPTIEQHEIDAAIETLNTVPHAFSTFYEVLPTLSSCIRGMLIPTKGYDMFTTDFSAIEARIVMWLAGEEQGLKMFRDQDHDSTLPDIYVYTARDIYSDQTLTKTKDPKKRELGKSTVLGAGFGMGVPRFIAECAKRGIIVDDALGRRCIYGYREKFKKVVNYWYSMEAAARRTIVSKQSHQCGLITWFMDGDFLRMRLPEGRCLSYHHPEVDADNNVTYMAVHSTTNQYVREHTWGGKLVENAVQATARDIMVHSMFNTIREGYTILVTIHDELLLEALTGTKNAEDIVRIVIPTPAWAKGCPINAECEKIKRYKK